MGAPVGRGRGTAPRREVRAARHRPTRPVVRPARTCRASSTVASGLVTTVGSQAVTPARGSAAASSRMRVGSVVTSMPNAPLHCRSTNPGTIRSLAASTTGRPASTEPGSSRNSSRTTTSWRFHARTRAHRRRAGPRRSSALGPRAARHAAIMLPPRRRLGADAAGETPGHRHQAPSPGRSLASPRCTACAVLLIQREDRRSELDPADADAFGASSTRRSTRSTGVTHVWRSRWMAESSCTNG